VKLVIGVYTKICRANFIWVLIGSVQFLVCVRIKWKFIGFLRIGSSF